MALKESHFLIRSGKMNTMIIEKRRKQMETKLVKAAENERYQLMIKVTYVIRMGRERWMVRFSSSWSSKKDQSDIGIGKKDTKKRRWKSKWKTVTNKRKWIKKETLIYQEEPPATKCGLSLLACRWTFQTAMTEEMTAEDLGQNPGQNRQNPHSKIMNRGWFRILYERNDKQQRTIIPIQFMIRIQIRKMEETSEEKICFKNKNKEKTSVLASKRSQTSVVMSIFSNRLNHGN